MNKIPSFGILQPAIGHRFRVNFFNDEINSALVPSMNGIDIDFIKRTATLRFDLTITGTDFCRQLNTILEGVRNKQNTLTRTIRYDFSEKILIEYLDGSNIDLLGGLLLETTSLTEDGLGISHDYSNSNTQNFNIQCQFNKAVFLSNEMLKNRGLFNE